VSAVARWGEKILLVRRVRGPAAGTWAIPGGHVRFGEDLCAAVVREVAEETRLGCVVERFLGWAEQIDAHDHHVILAFLVELLDPSAEPRAGDDAVEVRWWPVEDIRELTLAPGLLTFLDDVGVLRSSSRSPSRQHR